MRLIAIWQVVVVTEKIESLNNNFKEKTMFETTYENEVSYRSASEINSAMGRVYGHMSLAVIVSMIVSYFVGTSPELLQFFFTGWIKWLVILSPLAAIFGVAIVLANNPSKSVAQLCLHGFAALMGLSASNGNDKQTLV